MRHEASHQRRSRCYASVAMMRFGSVWSVTKESFAAWREDNASRLAAALAYYTLLSLAPLLVITIAVAGLFLGHDAASRKVGGELAAVVGASAGRGVQTVATHAAHRPAGGVVSTIIGAVVLFVGASGVFGQLQSALNLVWKVKPKPGLGLSGQVRHRFVSFTMVLGVAFLLLVSLVLSTTLSAVGKVISSALPGGEPLWHMVSFAVSFAVVTGLFALIFKYVPDAVVEWKDVWLGAIATGALFTLGKSLLGIYLGKAALSSSYGAAGSIVALVVWVYYAAQILFMGAELTRIRARRSGREIRPGKNAMPATSG